MTTRPKPQPKTPAGRRKTAAPAAGRAWRLTVPVQIAGTAYAAGDTVTLTDDQAARVRTFAGADALEAAD